MIISRIILKNWKNFRSIDAKLKERTFVVGPNASGKSNFLDAFRFLRDIAKPGGGLQKAISDRGGISKLRCLAARKDPEIVVGISLSEYGSVEVDWKYEIGIKQEARGHHMPYLSYEKVWKGEKLVVERPEPEDAKDKERLGQTYLEQINANKDFRDVAKYLEKALYLHIIPQLLKYPAAFAGADLPDDPFGKGFLDKLAKTPEKTRTAWIKKIDAALRIAVPQLKELHYKKDENGKPHLEALYQHWRPDAGKQKEEQFSDGTLRMIGLLWALQEGDGLLLLEEPELSLNAAIISRLPAIIYKIQKQKRRQVIMTSHSADLLADKGISLHEVLVFTPDKEGTKIDLAVDIAEVRAMLEGGMTPGDAILPRTAPKNIQQLLLEI
jgi:predicted ATPase